MNLFSLLLLIKNEIQEILDGIAAIKAENGDTFQIKQMEKSRKTCRDIP